MVNLSYHLFKVNIIYVYFSTNEVVDQEIETCYDQLEQIVNTL